MITAARLRWSARAARQLIETNGPARLVQTDAKHFGRLTTWRPLGIFR